MKGLQNRVVDLCLQKGIDDSKEYLDFLYLELKFYKNKLELLETQKPFWFQKKKMNDYLKERIDVEEKIFKYKKSILDELELISKMINS